MRPYLEYEIQRGGWWCFESLKYEDEIFQSGQCNSGTIPHIVYAVISPTNNNYCRAYVSQHNF